jgi:hypothetical protein
MKRLHAFLFTTLLAASASLRLAAAEPAPASPFGLTPSKPESLLPEGAGTLPLIPESIPQVGKPAFEKIIKEKKNVTDAAEDALRERIKLREARTKAQRDPGLQALWEQGVKAPTDYEQRKIWTDYYMKLYALIGKIDKSLKKADLEVLRDRDIGRFEQDRIVPTEPPVVARKARG